MAASSTGNAAVRIQALIVILPVICNVAPLPTSTKEVLPLNDSALPARPPAIQLAPLSVPVLLFPDASAVVEPDPSLNPYAATRPSICTCVGTTVQRRSPTVRTNPSVAL